MTRRVLFAAVAFAWPATRLYVYLARPHDFGEWSDVLAAATTCAAFALRWASVLVMDRVRRRDAVLGWHQSARAGWAALEELRVKVDHIIRAWEYRPGPPTGPIPKPRLTVIQGGRR